MKNKQKLAIIGASYLQEPLIQKAKSMGIETHVFAWAAGDVGEKSADYFYPISIVEKEKILEICREIKIDGICSIASDLAVITVCYVAEKMGLTGNSIVSSEVSTNKHKMRMCFEQNGDPSPLSIQIEGINDIRGRKFNYPIIVKPIDRSGSRGITELHNDNGLAEAIENAKKQGFDKHVLIEEFVTGQEYSVEFVSWEGKHKFLAMTKKYTTGAPCFVETAHLEPAPIEDELLDRVKKIVSHALDSLMIRYGASHSEIKIDNNGNIKIIEIGARMGGDNIGASLVRLSTGYDFLESVIEIALGHEPKTKKTKQEFAGIRFVFDYKDIECLKRIKAEHPEILLDENIGEITDVKVTDSSLRFGYYIIKADKLTLIEQYMPTQCAE